MTITEIILGMIFIFISTTLLVGGIKNIHKSATEISIAEFEVNKSRAIAYLCPLIGLLIIGWTLFRWKTSPSFDEPLSHYLLIGAGAIIYGLYRWFYLPQE